MKFAKEALDRVRQSVRRGRSGRTEQMVACGELSV